MHGLYPTPIFQVGKIKDGRKMSKEIFVCENINSIFKDYE